MKLVLVTHLQRHLHVSIGPIAGNRMFDNALLYERKSRDCDVPNGARDRSVCQSFDCCLSGRDAREGLPAVPTGSTPPYTLLFDERDAVAPFRKV
jgi:hypothetical protein